MRDIYGKLFLFLERDVVRTVAALAAMLFLQIGVMAQVTGAITGAVHDPSDAVVPGAKVILKNRATGDERQTTSNAAGYFTFAAVAPGSYAIKVESQGFKSLEIEGVTINVGDKRHYVAKMEVGNVQTNVTIVASEGEMTPVDSGERSAVLNSKQIQNLSLLGRDVTELIKILPGMSIFSGGGIDNRAGYDPTVAGIGSAVGNGYTANGAPNRGGTDLISDSAHIIDAGCNCNSTAQVNADMVQEVKVQTSNYGADSPKGPVVINAVGKSGSSEYHGQGYIYVRHSALNSTDWLINSQRAEKPRDRYLYPGFNIGGPVRIPGLNFNREKKLLFWAGFEYYNQRLPGSAPLTAYVPTAGMRQGNFTASGEGNAKLCSNGFAPFNWPPMCATPEGRLPNGSQIAGGIIPQNQFDPGGLAIMKMIPLPNADPATTGGFNYFKQILTNLNGGLFRTRVDYNFSENTKLYVSYQKQGQTSEVPVHLWWIPTFSVDFPGGGMSSKDRSHTLSTTFLHTFSPTLTNETVVSLASVDFPLSLVKPDAWSRASLGYPYKGVYNTGSLRMPGLSNGYWVPGYPQIDMPDFFTKDGGPFVWDKFSPSLQNNLTKVYRTHTMKFGFYTEKTVNNQGAWAYLNGVVFFGLGPYNTAQHPEGLGTFNPVANMLLGVAGTYTENNFNAITNMSFRTYSGFAQDSWKVTKRLTLELGLRFDRLAPWHDDDERAGFAVWFPERYASEAAQGKELPGISWHGKESGIPNEGHPTRWAYVSPRLSAAFDLFGEGKTVLRGGWGAYRWHEPYNDVAGALSTGLGARSYSIPNAMYLREIDEIGRNSNGNLGGLASGAFAVDPRDDQRPVTYSYNFTISQRMPWKSLLEVAYVGNTSRHMVLQDRLANQNLIPAGALFKPDPVTGAAPNPEGANLANYRPYRAYGNSNIQVTRHLGYANYNALQVSWNRQTGRLMYTLNYTWSKALGIRGTPQLGGALSDPNNLKDNYGVLSSDRSHVINTSYVFELGKLHSGGNKFLGGIANGWTISGITTWQSGPNLQALFNSNFSLSATAATAGGQAPLLSNRSWLGTPDIPLQPIITCDPRKGLRENQFINGACFTVPAIGQNGPSQMPYIHGPAYFNSDLSLYKTFKITERQNLQFRVSALNWLNHPLASFNPNATQNLQLQFTQNASGQWGLANQNFGFADVKLGRRVLNVALKYSF